MDDHLGSCEIAADQMAARADKREVAHQWSRFRAAVCAFERQAKHTPLRFSLLAVLVLLVLSFVAFQPSYETNDDVFMTMIAAGQGFCPAPDEHLIFTNVIIGHALKRLYTAWPQVPWYGCYLLFVHYAAQVVLLYCALTTDVEVASKGDGAVSRRCSTRLRLALYLIYFAVVELLFLNNLQFTTTAFLAAQAGIFLVVLTAQRRARAQDGAVAWPLGAAVALLVVAGLIRFEGLSMALLVSAPLGFILARKAPRSVLVPSAAAAAIAAMLIVLAIAFDHAWYEHDPRWRGFSRYNQLRVKFNDHQWTSYTPQTAKVFSAAGWTENDHEMIAHWFFDDPVVYSEGHLRFILDAYPWKTERLTMSYYWHVCRGLLRDRAVWAVILVLPFFLASMDRSRHARLAVTGCAIMAVALVAFLTWNSKSLPTRVFFPMLSFPLAVALLFPASYASASSLRVDDKTKGRSRLLHALSAWRASPPLGRTVVILLIVGIAMGVYRQGRRSVRIYRDRRAFETLLADLRPSERDLYVCWEPAMPFELVSPMNSLLSWPRIPQLNLAWTQPGAWHEDVKRRFGITSLAQAIFERDDIVIVAMPAQLPLFKTFAKEHFQADIEFVQSMKAGEKLVAGRFQRRAQPAENASERSGALRR